MTNEPIKIRVAGNKEQVEEFTEKVRSWAKPWGKRLIFRVKRYDRGEKLWKYHRTFGARRFVNYITMKLPRIPSKLQPCPFLPSCEIRGDRDCEKCQKKGALRIEVHEGRQKD